MHIVELDDKHVWQGYEHSPAIVSPLDTYSIRYITFCCWSKVVTLKDSLIYPLKGFIKP